jgi:hypothetical protein
MSNLTMSSFQNMENGTENTNGETIYDWRLLLTGEEYVSFHILRNLFFSFLSILCLQQDAPDRDVKILLLFSLK